MSADFLLAAALLLSLGPAVAGAKALKLAARGLTKDVTKLSCCAG